MTAIKHVVTLRLDAVNRYRVVCTWGWASAAWYPICLAEPKREKHTAARCPMRESAPQVHEPRRGSDVEAFLKRARDRFVDSDGTVPEVWHDVYAQLDEVLEDYRLRADTGTPLDQEAVDFPGPSHQEAG